MNRLARLEVDDGQGVPVARVVGEMDASNVQEVGRGLLEAVSNQAHGLVIDLSETSYLDSAGVHLLFDTAERLRRRQIKLHLVAPPESFVTDVLRVTSLPDGVEMYETIEEAMGAIGG